MNQGNQLAGENTIPFLQKRENNYLCSSSTPKNYSYIIGYAAFFMTARLLHAYY